MGTDDLYSPIFLRTVALLSGLCIRIIQEAFLKCQDLALTLRDSNLIDLDAQTF